MSPNRQKIESKNLDHLGLVAGMYDELGIGDVIDEAIEQDFEARHVSIGQTMKAMVLNYKSASLFVSQIFPITEAPPLKYLVSDSALYTKKTLQTLAQNPTLHWITRVPETIP